MMPCGTREEAFKVIYDSLEDHNYETAKAIRAGLQDSWKGIDHMRPWHGFEKMGASFLAALVKWWLDQKEGAIFFWYKLDGQLWLTRYYISAPRGRTLHETFPDEETAHAAFITEAKWALEDSEDPYWGWTSDAWRKGA